MHTGMARTLVGWALEPNALVQWTGWQEQLTHREALHGVTESQVWDRRHSWDGHWAWEGHQANGR